MESVELTFVNGSDTSSSRRVLPPAKPSGGSCSLCDSDLPSSAADDARLLSLRLLLRLSHVTIPIKVQAMTTTCNLMNTQREVTQAREGILPVITTTAISHDTPREPEGTLIEDYILRQCLRLEGSSHTLHHFVVPGSW